MSKTRDPMTVLFRHPALWLALVAFGVSFICEALSLSGQQHAIGVVALLLTLAGYFAMFAFLYQLLTNDAYGRWYCWTWVAVIVVNLAAWLTPHANGWSGPFMLATLASASTVLIPGVPGFLILKAELDMRRALRSDDD